VCYYYPTDFQTAYAVNSIAHGNGGAGITIGVVDAYHNSHTEDDLAFYSSYFNLPACSVATGCLTIVSQTGVPCSVANACTPTPSSPQSLQNWALETDLDLEAIHALAPNAHILLVSAASSGGLDLYAAVQYAYSNGADLVTNSWGGG
jgi:subtilase family serine protease